MRRTSDEVSQAALRRLELLREELARAGVRPLEPETGHRSDDHDDVTDDRPALAAPRRETDYRLQAAGDLPRPDDPGDLGERALGTPVGVGRIPADAPLREAGRHARRRTGLLDGVGSRAGGWVADRLPASLQGRVSLGPGQIAVVAVLAALAMAVTAVWALRSGGGATPVSSPVRASGQVPGAPTAPTGGPAPGDPAPGAMVPSAAAPGQAGAAGAAGAAKEVVVDVGGKVRRPGVVTLPPGSRVVDAIERAGGVVGRPKLFGLNQARLLVDGEQVLVGVKAAPGVAASAAAAPGAASPGSATGGDLVNINTADQTELESLPGVGPVTAQKILTWRTQHGSFSAVDELMEIDGIGEKTLAELAPHVTI